MPVLVQSSEVRRVGLFEDKTRAPARVDQLRSWKYNKGFGVYAMNGPLLEQWEFIAERTTDLAHQGAPVGKQFGSGSLDVPAWAGGKYMFLAAAPDDSYALTECPSYLHSPGYQSWDMSDRANPRPVQQLTVPGQIVGRPDHKNAYLMNPRAGNRTSWMGARMPLFIPEPGEEGVSSPLRRWGGLPSTLSTSPILRR